MVQKKSRANATILVVDDSSTNILLMTSILESENFPLVLTAANATKALSIIQMEDIDLVLLDIMMPGKMDGLDLLKMIKEDAAIAHIPILIMSAKREPEDFKKAKELGAFAYYTKPINIQLFIDELDKLFL